MSKNQAQLNTDDGAGDEHEQAVNFKSLHKLN